MTENEFKSLKVGDVIFIVEFLYNHHGKNGKPVVSTRTVTKIFFKVNPEIRLNGSGLYRHSKRYIEYNYFLSRSQAIAFAKKRRRDWIAGSKAEIKKYERDLKALSKLK